MKRTIGTVLEELVAVVRVQRYEPLKEEKKLKPAASPLLNSYSASTTPPEVEKCHLSRHMENHGRQARMRGGVCIAKSGSGLKMQLLPLRPKEAHP